MSLFGDSPPASPLPTTTSTSAFPSNSLFGDEPVQKSSNTGSSLFADNGATDSPWSMPTPKRNSRQNLIKSLLPATDVPEDYVDAYDLLLNSAQTRGSGVSLSAIHNILQDCGLDATDQESVLNIIVGGGQEPANGFGRNEFNVLLALIGLAQEGEEVSLDSVDDRRRRLPRVNIAYIKKLQAQNKPDPVPVPAVAPPLTSVPSQSSSPLTPRPNRNKPRQDSLGGDPSSDPWASPSNTRTNTRSVVPNMKPADNSTGFGTASVNGVARTTSNFTTSVQSIDNDTSPNMTSGMSNDGAAPWGSYNGNSGAGFSDPSGLSGGFEAPSTETPSRPMRPTHHSATGSIAIPPGTGEIVNISVLPDKEGMFLFQHHNYEVKTVRRGSSVVRRYSDFVWLLDCLQKRYPFRRLPLLPPKRVKVNGNHLAADGPTFLEKRRRGLVRFMNTLVQHPVLSQETLVVMFLTVPTELSVWRKQATISVQEEFVGKALPHDLEDSLPSTLPELFEQVRAGVKRAAEIYINLCVLLDRLAKRNEAMAADNHKFSLALQSLTEGSADTYAIDTNDVPLLNEGITATAKHLSQSQALLEDEARAWDAGALEDFKKIRDAMVSMKDMFDRRDKFARDNIPQLERRIQSSETKLHALRQKPAGQVKAGEMEKVESSIMSDKESIVQQHARGVFIKECVRDEIVTLQSTIFAISHLHQDWAQERVKYAELQASNWRSLVENTDSMPTSQS